MKIIDNETMKAVLNALIEEIPELIDCVIIQFLNINNPKISEDLHRSIGVLESNKKPVANRIIIDLFNTDELIIEKRRLFIPIFTTFNEFLAFIHLMPYSSCNSVKFSEISQKMVDSLPFILAGKGYYITHTHKENKNEMH